jgi:hypothetical protein
VNWRSYLLVLVLGLWVAALASDNLMGGLVHLLLPVAGILIWAQVALKPAKTPFEVWQDKPRRR